MTKTKSYSRPGRTLPARSSSWAAVSVAMLPLWGASAVHALSQYPDKLPNGAAFSCGTCHVSEYGGGARNAFGRDVSAHKSGTGLGANIRWSELWYLDSDGDGQTNGQELGDPCGQWASGGTPERSADISNPGDDESTSANPGTACPGPGSDADAGPGTETDAGSEGEGGADAGSEPDGMDAPAGGCSAQGVPTSETPWLALAGVAVLGLLGLRRRR